MTKRVLSIVIGTEYTKVCEVSYNRNNIKKGIKVYRSISFPTPKNSIEDGFIRNMNAFGEELTIQLRANDFKSNKVIFSVASSKIASREVILPLVNENRIMDIIRTGASEYFPIDINRYGREELKDYRLEITSISVKELEDLYKEEPYSTEDADLTNKLSGYHLLIIDNPNIDISDRYGAASNIKDEIKNGLAVVFTKNALGYGNRQASLLIPQQHIFLDQYTYNWLHRRMFVRILVQRPLYSDLESNGNLYSDAPYGTNYLTKTNEGSVTRYPYVINRAIQSATNTYSNYATVDYNLLENQNLIGWYSLSDQKSPLIGETGLYKGGNSKDFYKGLYSTSPNDVKNNYYLFSKEWIYYSGIDLKEADKAGNDDEIKLFMNTIIAAYQASKRMISSPPVIEIIDPEPVMGEDMSQTITIRSEDISQEEFILLFKISESSSPMNVEIQMDGENPPQNWNEFIYEVDGLGDFGDAIEIGRMDKNIDNGLYAIKIPISNLSNSNLLSIRATNRQDQRAICNVTLLLTQNPVLKIIDPEPSDELEIQYIYVDIDFNAMDANDLAEEYLMRAKDVKVIFELSEALTPVLFELSSEGRDIRNEIRVHPIIDNVEEELPLNWSQPRENGFYALYIPVSFLKGYGSRELTLKAVDQYGGG